MTLPITAIGAGGDGISEHNGKPVYVPKTTAGDVVEIRVEKENADGIQARLLKIETPSPNRVTPPCPYFDRCGGCALQHINDNTYKNWKTEKVLQNLQRAGVEIETLEETVFLPANTRRRTTMVGFKTGKDIHFGYFEYRSHNIVDTKTCLILEPELDAKMQALRAYLPRLLPYQKPIDFMMQHIDGTFDLVITGIKNPKLEQLEAFAELAEALDIARISICEREFATPEILFTRTPVRKKFGDIQVTLPPGTFLQASVAGENALTQIVSRYAKGRLKVADLFCGSGTFTGTLLQNNMAVHAIDGDYDAMQALGAVKHKNLTTERRNLFKEPLSTKELSAFDGVVIDPPRAGAKAQIENLAQSNVAKIIAVSCNPATFARDAETLQDAGYGLSSLTIVDQFVWSAHVETVALFTA